MPKSLELCCEQPRIGDVRTMRLTLKGHMLVLVILLFLYICPKAPIFHDPILLKDTMADLDVDAMLDEAYEGGGSKVRLPSTPHPVPGWSRHLFEQW